MAEFKARVFTIADQLAFAELSGDFNPMHVDEVAARRLLFGGAVVHGIHSVCWALGEWLSRHATAIELRSLNVVFLKPMRVGSPVHLTIEDETENTLKLRIQSGDDLATRIVCEFSASKPAVDLLAALNATHALASDCVERTEYEGASGSIPLRLPVQLAIELLPNLPSKLPAEQIATLLATTRLVGMECPGLHSIFSALQLSFSEERASDEMQLDWGVTAHDQRFGSLSLALKSAVATGTIRAFVRPAPAQQPPFVDFKSMVGADDFAGTRALVIGGSRGFGEVCAKILAAGGADVCVTYHRGADDAQQVASDISAGGGRCSARQFDVTNLPSSIAEFVSSDWHPTHLFYFATPLIGRASKNHFSPELFSEFCSFYIEAVSELVESLAPLGLTGLYYPSTVFVDELPTNMGEYAAAKAAGETLCAFFEKARPGFRAVAPRLPKSATDQTASFIPTQNEAPASVLLRTIRPLFAPEQ